VRIALLNSIRSYGGGEKRVLTGADEYSRRGCQVLVVGRAGAELLHRCEEAGVAVASAPFGNYLAPATLRPLSHMLSRWNPDVVVTYDERSLRAAALALRLTRNRACLMHYHGLEGALKNKWFNRWVVNPRVDCYVANAAALREELLAFGWIPERKAALIYDGVDPRPLDEAEPGGLREELNTPLDAIVVLVCARLAPQKGHDVLLRALPQLRVDSPWQVWVAGAGPAEEALKQLAVDLGVDDRVQWLGFRSDVPRLMRAADILCHPSRREGAPNAVREAMCAGLPVVAAASSGTPELITEGETGLLAPPGDVEALARHLQRLLNDAEERAGLGAAGRARALRDFSEERSALLWLELFEEQRLRAIAR